MSTPSARRRRLRASIARRQGWACAYCLKRMDRRPGGDWRPDGVTLDHVVPLCRGGADAPSNLVAACYRCNQAKGDGLVRGEGAA